MLLGLLRSALVVHPELKAALNGHEKGRQVVLMSATIDAKKFQSFFAERSGDAGPPPVWCPIKTLKRLDVSAVEVIVVKGHSFDARNLGILEVF